MGHCTRLKPFFIKQNKSPASVYNQHSYVYTDTHTGTTVVEKDTDHTGNMELSQEKGCWGEGVVGEDGLPSFSVKPFINV